MITIILAIALLVSLAGLGIEIGIASWNIRRASKYLRREAAAEHTAARAVEDRQEMAKRLEFLDGYASKISWLLNFLYNRYDKFADLEREVQEGLKGVTGDTPIAEADAKYKELKRALKIIRVTVKAFERMEDLANSINTQISQIIEDFRDEEEEEQKSESPKPDESVKGEDEKSPEPEASGTPEAEAPDAEVPAT
jgi:hypothetical protein